MLIELKNVSVKQADNSILRGLNLSLQPGRITAILGQSGAGLSVLLKTIAGLIPPTSGQVLYDGQDPESFKHKDRRLFQTRTGFMFQDAALWSNMTLAANLDLPLQAKYPDLDPQARQQMVQEALQEYGFSVDLNQRPVDLSLGEKKFMSFLRAVIPGPEALMMDEPIAYLDRQWGDRIIEKLGELRSQGTTLVLSSHHPRTWFDKADHLVALHQGEMIFEGSSQEARQATCPLVREILQNPQDPKEVSPK